MSATWKVWAALVLRSTTLISRFGLVMVLAALSSAEVVGAFGLYSSGLLLSCALMGMDVYATTSRQLLSPRQLHKRPLQAHAGYLILSFIVFAPIAVVFANLSGAIAGSVFSVLFVLHLCVEYFCQEFGRLLVVLGMPLGSTIVLFIRSTLWVPVAAVLVWMFPGANTMQVVIVVWAVGSALAAVTTWWVIRVKGQSLMPLFDWIWMRRAVGAAFVFFLATLVLRTLLNGDKFLVNAMLPLNMVGIYTVYAAVGMGILALAETGVSAWLYPRLVAAIQAREWSSVVTQLRHFRNRMITSAVVGTLCMAAVVPLVFGLLGKAGYAGELQAYYLILAGTGSYCASMPYHYVIYGFKADKVLFWIYSGGLLCMLLVGALTIPVLGMTGAGIMSCAALSFVGIGRVIVARKLLSARLEAHGLAS